MSDWIQNMSRACTYLTICPNCEMEVGYQPNSFHFRATHLTEMGKQTVRVDRRIKVLSKWDQRLNKVEMSKCTYFAEQIARVDETRVRVRARAVQRCKLNLLTGAMDERLRT